MNKKIKKYLIIAAVIVIACGLYFFLPGSKKSATVLDTAKVEKGDVSTSVTATGTIEPIKLVEVGTQVSGVISKIYVDFNSVVKKGDILAELDKNLLNSELENAQANLMTNKIELEHEQRNYDRQKGLWEKQAISKVDWENAQTSYETAKYAVTSSKAAVFKAQTNLGYATISSTIDGVVISRAVEEGQTVAASFSTPTLFTIANDLTKMRVIANVDEADIGGVVEGQRVSFTVDAYPNDDFDGKVVQVRLEATTTSNVVTYEVVIDAPNPDLKLKPGLTASVNIYTMEEKDVLKVPSKALRFMPNPDLSKEIKDLVVEHPIQTDPKNKNQKLVWVKSDNKLSARLITVGVSDGILVMVKEGLNEGDVIVTGISQKATKGAEPEATAANGESSPFMPKRPGGGGRR
ncbi:efflux RND transporter periplasmic adaptor subunit [Dysgonomonas sp. HGC4]|uniref:efflux RND transporter periplasmic adaptor subunit n=1 Tax=Dysgonomonas sp. HGC4 TaxID=1658009 RepID=UPI00068211E9|nr:efflux RND transporter periplasmic adaptor subunit [Dysgonomonas sp. HGC4]MBD8346607.1 efflux RND transporter periplasmic adaptor subunit [Dysgonomonas sp. HGC4]